jgi:hypothetical protein
MTSNTTSTRRSFLQGGALLAAPIAAASVSAIALADGRLQERVTRLEDEAAIRTVHHSWLRQVNAGERDAQLGAAVRRITADHAGAADRIEIAADHQSAVGYFDHAVEFETSLPKDSTLAQMAHAQGHGALCRTERRVLTVGYTKVEGSWKLAQVTLATLAAGNTARV